MSRTHPISVPAARLINRTGADWINPRPPLTEWQRDRRDGSAPILPMEQPSSLNRAGQIIRSIGWWRMTQALAAAVVLWASFALWSVVL